MDLKSIKTIVPLIPLLPLLGWALIGILGKKIGPKTVSSIAVSVVAGSFILGLVVFQSARALGFENIPPLIYGNWIFAHGFKIPFGFQIDQLSMLMVLTVSGVGALIHIYSIGYMKGDPGFSRYFSYLNLFMFFMLVLVLAENYVLMFVGWEGVGLCSYLLIGFWYENSAPTQAGKKAFIVNRIGDAGFIIGMFLLVTSPLAIEPGSMDGIRSLSYSTIFTNTIEIVEQDPEYFALTLAPLVGAITLLLFFGATGKSAQIPLYVWLPDAMEGPTPVSALIHAATMVTAGVYMVARSHVLFALSPGTMAVIAIVGAVTAIFAATIALVQTDIKKVLAYSTISQLGYMFLACGVGAFFAGIFHLMTHAFFKACLFLGAGSVILGNHHEQDIRKLGGLAKWMPSTRWTFLIATATIAGFPGFAGFFSKDTILHEAFVMPFAGSAGAIAGIIGYITALLTAIYMFRLYFKTFHGEYAGSTHHEPHETPPVMTGVLWVLAGLSIIGGWVGISLPGKQSAIFEYLNPVFEKGLEVAEHYREIHHAEIGAVIFMVISVILFGAGLAIANNMFKMTPDLKRNLKVRYREIYELLWDKYRIDELYARLFVKPGMWLCGILWKNVDEAIIDDGLVEGTGRATENIGRSLSPLQSGYLRSYALYIVIGIALLIWLSSY